MELARARAGQEKGDTTFFDEQLDFIEQGGALLDFVDADAGADPGRAGYTFC
jgi:hypothetical protein